MISFILALAILVIGYIVYGRYISRVFGVENDRKTPCYTMQDGVDYIPMPTWKVYMIQFLNIAGLGPIFGAIMGAKFGTAAYLWIVFGTLFGGAVHDYLAGMVSLRMKGASLPEIIGFFLGRHARKAMGLFISVLMILVGAVFISGPAELLSNMTSSFGMNTYVWIGIIFVYYVIATLCPVDQIIGRIYPFFAFCLIFMAVGILGYLLINRPELPEIWSEGSLVNTEWESNAIFPMMFISIACGAISGFHATQSPLMARCIKSEAMGRRCFYGAMVTEGIVALIWAAAATCFFSEHGVINEATGKGYTGAFVASEICNNWLGVVGGILAILGIAIAPITSGDTALRSGRLIIADFFKLEQHSMRKRLYVAVPMFILTTAVLVWSMNDAKGFGILWRYFAWCNQALSVFTLWAITVYLLREKKQWWVTFFPALFMTCVCSCYILVAPEGLALPYHIGIGIGVVFSVFISISTLVGHYRHVKQHRKYPKLG